MATSMTGSSFPVPASAIHAGGGVCRRRRISPQSGHALEILGHAIEYLTDEFVREGGSLSPDNPQLVAVQLLMAANRQIYFACPEVPTLGERIRAWLHRHPPQLHQNVKLHR